VERQEFVLARGSSSPTDFISQRPVFRLEEAEAWYLENRRGDRETARRALAYHVSTGRLFLIRRGVYVHSDCSDSCLVASRLTTDAIIAFDGALSIRGLHGGAHHLSYLTRQRLPAVCFADRILQPVRLTDESDYVSAYYDSTEFHRGGLTLRATKLERTLVDCVERLDRAPDLEELVLAFNHCGPINFDTLLSHVRRRKSPLLASRLAFMLYASLRLDPLVGGALMSLGLQRPDYFLRSARGPDDSIITRWNLIVSPEQRALYEAARAR
jgi:hypothetical protein